MSSSGANVICKRETSHDVIKGLQKKKERGKQMFI
jgi:hypothetical protein